MRFEQPKVTNLNQSYIEVENGQPARLLNDYSTMSENGEVSVYFRELEEQLIRHIREAQMVVGCVAWLTSEPVLRALSEVKRGVAIVVQKEDFLRPDLGSSDNWRNELRQRYDTLQAVWKYHQWRGLMNDLSWKEPEIASVRCVGNCDRNRAPAFPRMHNKFLVFCNVTVNETIEDCDSGEVEPYAVWTGSFNLTKNATASLENAIVVRDSRIVEAYFKEWQQIEAIAEPLNWTSVWIEPEWRIGS